MTLKELGASVRTESYWVFIAKDGDRLDFDYNIPVPDYILNAEVLAIDAAMFVEDNKLNEQYPIVVFTLDCLKRYAIKAEDIELIEKVVE